MEFEPELAQKITESQQRIYGYIFSLVGKSAASWDILQETNLVLWRKQDESREAGNFDAWAFTIARFQVMAHFRDRKREPFSVLTPELVELFAEDAEEVTDQTKDRLEALRKCKQRLSEKSRRLIELYYEKELGLEELSSRLGSSRNALKQALYRARRSLFDCIENSLPTSNS